MTLQWATRMGGVNTSSGNIHGGEQPIQGDREQEESLDEAYLEELRKHINERNEEE